MRAMDSSAREVTGKGDLHRRVEFAGRTDRQIARDLLRAGGNHDPADQEVAKLIDGYLTALARGVTQRAYEAIGDVREAVTALRAVGATVGLGTGNVCRGAGIKLASAGLDDLFDLSMGGYGDDADTRAELLIVGAKRCDPTTLLPVVIIGDTAHDIRAARAMGAASIAVTTGPFNASELRACGPDEVLEHLDASLVEVVAGVLARRQP